MVAQDTLLFSATIAENIAFGRPHATQETDRTPNSPRPMTLSSTCPTVIRRKSVNGAQVFPVGNGKSRRYCPRILLDPKILILDDSMSAVDAETEKLLQAAIRSVMQGRTTILIAHRLSTVQMQADRIIVLRNGEIVEQGTHDELSAGSGYYQHVLEMQRMSSNELEKEQWDKTVSQLNCPLSTDLLSY